MSRGESDQHITMEEFEALALAVGRGVGDEEKLKRAEKHLLSCPSCEEDWSVEELLRRIPASVVEVHLQTIAEQIRKR